MVDWGIGEMDTAVSTDRLMGESNAEDWTNFFKGELAFHAKENWSNLV